MKVKKADMKICLVSDELVGYHDTMGGAALVCQYVARFLQKENQELIFITARFKKKNNSKAIFQIPTVNIKNAFLKKIIAPFVRISGIIYAFYYLRKTKPDIVHLFHSNYLSIPVMASCHLLRIPTVFSVLDYFIVCPRNNLRLDGGKICSRGEGRHCLKCVSPLKFLEKLIIKPFFKNLKGVITFTETSRQRLIKYGIPADKIKVSYTFNLPPEFADRHEVQDGVIPNSILFVGTFFEYKGLQVLIQAMPKIISEVPGSKLMIIGSGNEQDIARIEKMVDHLGISDFVHFLGKKKNEEVLGLIPKSEIVVVPEQWPSDFGPLILVEAMVLAKPVVASNIGAIPEFIRNNINGLLADFNNPEQFALKIIQLLKNKQVAKIFGQEARKNIQVFLDNNKNEEIIKLYNDILFTS